MTNKTIGELTEGRADCPICLGCGWVCENHPDKAWGEMVYDAEYQPLPGTCSCGSGAPCPKCNIDLAGVSAGHD